jgi:LuxR family maltose regulon positive regulatory protein
VQYVVAAGRVVDPEFGSATSVLLDELAAGANNRPIVRVTLIHELAELAGRAPIAFVLDDYHEVDAVAEIRNYVAELLANAPDGLTFIISARRRPTIAVSRLRTAGEVAELGRPDLQFGVAETEALFRDAFARPIERDVLEDLVRRTEGWAASLQLVDTAIRDRTSAEARSFINGITGARGDLYDYLAEEVVGDLPADVRDFLMWTSVLRVLTPDHTWLVTGLEASAITSRIGVAQKLSLLDAVPGSSPTAHRYHPLVREFLESRLRQERGDDVAIALHRRVAEATEDADWRTAAYHYDRIGAIDDVQRLLLENAATIMARGEFDLAKSYVDGLNPAMANPAMDLFISRIDLDQGRSDAAINALELHTRRSPNQEARSATWRWRTMHRS